MRKALALSIIVTILGVTAYFFKPSEKQYLQKAGEEFRKKISYTIETSPKGVDKNLFAQTLEKHFLQELAVEDKFLYKDIYQTSGGIKNKIGWGALGWVTVDIK